MLGTRYQMFRQTHVMQSLSYLRGFVASQKMEMDETSYYAIFDWDEHQCTSYLGVQRG
jgi:hypothetical protein